MGDWIGLIFLVVLLAAAVFGLRQLSIKRVSTEDEFEARASESSTLLGTGAEAINGLFNPALRKVGKRLLKSRRVSFKKIREKAKHKAQGTDAQGEK